MPMNGLPEKITGSWILKSFLIRSTDGKVRPWSQSCAGLLMYSEDGFMSVFLRYTPNADSNVTDESSNLYADLGGGHKINIRVHNAKLIELEKKMASFFYYGGRYTILNHESLLHIPEYTSHPDLFNQPQFRYFRFAGGALVLTGMTADGVIELTWNRSGVGNSKVNDRSA